MPTYEYACTSCGHEWEEEQSIKADPLEQCPKCEAQTAKRQISRGVGFILKGSGWYSDLYSGSSNKKDETKSDDSSSTKTESTPSTSSDSGGSSGSTKGDGGSSTGSSGTGSSGSSPAGSSGSSASSASPP